MSDTATVSPTPTEAIDTATPATEPVDANVGTAETNGSEAAEAAPSEESFYSGDPNSLPPELRQAYTNMLKDYKQKTQAVADVRKKADAYDKISQDQRFKDYWQTMSREQKADFKEKKAEAEQRLGEKISDEDFAKAFQSKDDFLSFLERVVEDRSAKSQKKIEHLEQQLTVKDATDFVSAFATEVGKDGKPIRPDFYQLDDDQLITGFLRVNPPEQLSREAYAERLNEAYSWAKNLSQKYYEKGKSEALKIIQGKVNNSSQPPTQAAKGAYTGPDPKKITPAEALQMAKKGIRVPQVYD